MDSGFKNLNETLDSTSEGIKVSPKTEESSKEIEIREYQGVILSENKNNNSKEDNKYLEKKTKKIRKTCRKKIINTREELEMIKGGLINVFNLPINEQRELIKFRSQLNMSTIEVCQTTSVISSIRNIPFKYLVNNPEVKGNGMVLNMSDYVMLEELQYLSVKKELTITGDRYLNEGLVAAKWESRMVMRLSRREIIPNTPVIRGRGVTEFMDHG